MIDLSRRSLLIGGAALIAAPAIVHAELIMPIRPIHKVIWQAKKARPIRFRIIRIDSNGNKIKSKWFECGEPVPVSLNTIHWQESYGPYPFS